MPNAPMLTLLKSHFGYDDFRPLQEEIIENVLAKGDTLVLMATGGGKSLCYQLPALMLDGVTLVISPLIALMKDQVDALRANGVDAAFINSSLTRAEVNRVCGLAQAGRIKVLYLAPERLALPDFRGFLDTLPVSLIAIDEAHCISEWGHEFRPDYRNLKALRQQFPAAPVIALTATATPRVRQDVVAQLGLEQGRVFLSSFNRANLNYSVAPKRDSFQALVDLLQEQQNQPAIIYCFSRRDTEALAADLCRRGFAALPYHAGLENAQRQETQDKFVHDQVNIIVATIAFGMGIDKPDIRLIVHYAMPKSVEGYYQETGRAGRDGLPSQCVLFYSYGDKIKQDFFINQMEDAAGKENAATKLSQMVDFCQSLTCRRRFLLDYFAENFPDDGCGGCDVCLTPREEFDATEIAQKVLSAVIRTGQRFGMNHVIGVLQGASGERIRNNGHDQLSVYGIAADRSQDDLREIVGLLVAQGLLDKSEGQYPTLAVSPAGQQFLQRREALTLTRPRRSPAVDASGPPTQLDYDTTLFEELRDLRRRLAGERGVPPYVVFSDASLREMAYYLPQSLDNFAQVNGVGAAKLAEYGESFLAVIRDHAQTHQLKGRPIPSRRDRRSGRNGPGGGDSASGNQESEGPPRRPSPTYYETKGLLEQGLTINQVAQQRGLSEGTIINHLERLVMAGEKLDLAPLLPPPEYSERIEAAFREHGAQFLKPVMDALGEGYSYEELRLVRVYLRQRGEGEE